MIATVLIRNDEGEWIPKGTIRFQDKIGEDGINLVADSVPAQRIMDSTFHWKGVDWSKKDGILFLQRLPDAVNGSYVKVVLEEPEAAVPQRHAREPDLFAADPVQPRPLHPKPRGYSSIPRLLLELDAQKKHTPPQ